MPAVDNCGVATNSATASKKTTDDENKRPKVPELIDAPSGIRAAVPRQFICISSHSERFKLAASMVRTVLAFCERVGDFKESLPPAISELPRLGRSMESRTAWYRR